MRIFISVAIIGFLVFSLETIQLQQAFAEDTCIKTEKFKDLKEMYANLNMGFVPIKGKAMFSGSISKDAIAVGSKVYIHTHKGVCETAISEIYEDNNDAGDGALARRTYLISLAEDSLCRNQAAILAFGKHANLSKNIYNETKMMEGEYSTVHKLLVQKYKDLSLYKLSFKKLINKDMLAFYVVLYQDSTRSYQHVFRINNDNLKMIYWGIGETLREYGEDMNVVLRDSVMLDLNENGLPEIILLESNRYAGGEHVIELGSSIELKTLSFYSD